MDKNSLKDKSFFIEFIIEDVKTFTSSPIVPTPTAVNQAVNKQYVDNMVISPNGSNSYAVAMAIVFGS